MHARTTTFITDLWLAADDVGCFDSFGGIPGVDDKLRLLDDLFVVIAGVVGDDEDGVELAKVVERGAGHVEVVVAAVADGGEEGVVVGDDGSFCAQQLDDGERG